MKTLVLLLAGAVLLQDPSPDALDTVKRKYGALLPCATLGDADRCLRFEALARRYLSATTAAERDALRGDFKEFETLDVSKIRSILKYGGHGWRAKLEAGDAVELSVNVEGRGDPLPVTLHAPEEYDRIRLAKDGSVARLPLVIVGHVDRPLSKLPVFQAVLPTSLWYEEGWGAGLLGIRAMEKAVRDLLDAFPIDPDRVFVSGSSGVGYGAWHAALHRPDLLAGIRVDASMPVCPLLNKGTPRERPALPPLANLVDTSIHWIVEPKDEAHFPTYMLGPVLDRMSKLPFADLARCVPGESTCGACGGVGGWLAERKRPADGGTLEMESDEKVLRRVRWIEILRFKVRETYRLPVRLGSGAGADTVEERWKFVDNVRVRATIDAAKRTIAIEADGVDQVRLYLGTAQLPLDAGDVSVTFNGAARPKQRLVTGPARMVECARLTGNRTVPYETWIDVSEK